MVRTNHMATVSSERREIATMHSLIDAAKLTLVPYAAQVNWCMCQVIKSFATGTTWRTLIAYQKLVASKLDAGIERALGGAVLAQGGFEEHAIYEWYNQEVTLN